MKFMDCKNDCSYFEKIPTETGITFACLLYENPIRDCRLRDCCCFCGDRCS